jgi:O-antigen/teichoic acid export membrane protein
MSALRTRLRALRHSAHARSLGGTAFSLFASQAMLGISGVLAARELGPSGKGIVTAVTTWPMMLGYLSILGMNNAVTVRVARRRRDGLPSTLGSAVAYSIVTGTVVAQAAIAVIPAVLSHLGPDARVLTIWALATLPIILLGDMLLSVNVALGRMRLSNWCRIIPALLILLGTLGLVVAGEASPARIVAVNLLGGVPPLVVGALGLPWRSITLDARELAADLRFGVRTHLGGVLAIANVRLDVLLISAFLPASQLGYYGVANSMMIPVMFAGQAAAVLITPRVAAMSRGGERGGLDGAQLASIRAEGRRFVLIGVAGAALVAALAPFAVPVVFGRSFAPVVALVWVLLPGCVARNYAGLMSAGAIGGRRPWIGNIAEGVGLVLTVGLLLLLLPHYHAMGAAITTTVAYSVTALVARLAIRHYERRTGPGEAPPVGEAPLGEAPLGEAPLGEAPLAGVTPPADVALLAEGR